MQPDSSGQIGHVVFVAGLEYLVIPRACLGIAFPSVAAHPVQSEPPHASRRFRVGSRDHAALASRHILGGIETERGCVAMTSNLASLILAAGSVSRVFQKRNTAGPRK